jgi:hypothetical protein
VPVRHRIEPSRLPLLERVFISLKLIIEALSNELFYFFLELCGLQLLPQPFWAVGAMV